MRRSPGSPGASAGPSEGELVLHGAQELVRHARDLAQVVDRVEAPLPVAIGDHPGRLGDREAQVAELLERRAVEVDLLAGGHVAVLIPCLVLACLGGRLFVPAELDLLELVPLRLRRLALLFVLAVLPTRTDAENRPDGPSQDSAMLLVIFRLRSRLRKDPLVACR